MADSDWLADLRRRLTDHQLPLADVLREVVDHATSRIGADRGTLYLLDHARRELVSQVAHLPEISEIRLRVGEGVAGRVAEDGVSRLWEESEEGLLARIDAATGYRTRAMLAVAVRRPGGPVIGVLQLLNKSRFDARDQARLEVVAHEVADMLDASSLQSQLQPDHRQPLAFRFNHIVGESPAMQEVYARISRAATTDATVLIRGESGTGKELLARAIHYSSKRRGGPFVKVDCAALPKGTVENELFGHEKGGFTGADRQSGGLVGQAVGGTLFLDEIGELPLEIQGKLLRLVQDRSWVRVGGSEACTGDIRFVAATHRDLARMVDAGGFRGDLYWRLRVVEVLAPPLRTRGHADIDRLIDHFVWSLSRRHGRPGMRLTDAARARLHGGAWPGNVRELEHVIESSVVLASGLEIGPGDLELAEPSGPDGDVFTARIAPLEDVERAYARWVLDRVDGNRSEAARILGISRNTLARKVD